MHITRKRFIHRFQYSISGDNLGVAQLHPFLGVEFSVDLTWNSDVSRVSANANRLFGSGGTCTNARKDPNSPPTFRPHLDHTSSVRDVYT